MAPLEEYPTSLYQQHGFDNRKHYIKCLREDFGAELVDAMLEIMPPSEDFDGLITELEDNFDSFYN